MRKSMFCGLLVVMILVLPSANSMVAEVWANSPAVVSHLSHSVIRSESLPNSQALPELFSMVGPAARPATAPVIGPIRFSIDLESDTGRILSSGYSFPNGILQICAYWSYSGVSQDTVYSFTWYRNGLPYRQGADVLASGSGIARQYLQGAGGYIVEPGIYQFVLDAEGQQLVSDPCTVAPDYRSAGDWTRCVSGSFRRGYSESSTRIMIAGTRFAQGVAEILGGVSCYGMATGAPYRATWYQNDKAFLQSEGVFESEYGGAFEPLANPDGAPLAPATYRLVFEVAGRVVAGGEAVVEGFGGFSARPFFGKLNFAIHFDEAQDFPLHVGEVFDPGATAVYAYWPYDDMTVGTPYRVTWLHNGAPFFTSEGVFDAPRGMGWAKATRQDGMSLEPGGYQAVVEVNGAMVLGSACVIAEEPEDPSQYGPLVFAAALDEADQPVDPGVYFHYGITQLYSHWPYWGMATGIPYLYIWYHNGEELARQESQFDRTGDSIWQVLRYRDQMPLDPGPYEIYVEVGGVRELHGTCFIEDAQNEVYGPVVFSSDFDDESQDPVDIDTRFNYGVTQLYGYWAFRNAPVGTPYTYTWYRDGAVIAGGEDAFDWPAGRSWQSVFNDDGAPLAKGLYTFNIAVNDAVVVAEQCAIE